MTTYWLMGGMFWLTVVGVLWSASDQKQEDGMQVYCRYECPGEGAGGTVGMASYEEGLLSTVGKRRG